MVRVIKIGNLIYENIEPYTTNEKEEKIWKIPNDPTKLREAIIDTLGWLVEDRVKKSLSADPSKKDASTAKSICLLAKILSSLNPDLSNLTDKEKSAFNKLVSLANSGYTDSDLMNFSLDTLSEQLNWYAHKVEELGNLTTVDEMIKFLEEL